MTATTVWLDRATHARLLEAKQRMKARSLGEAIQRLLDGPQETAAMIYKRRKKQVDAACRKHGVRKLVAFGSRARGDAKAGSDLDVAIDLPLGEGFNFIHAQRDIEQAFACPTDVIDWPAHRPGLMAEIERDAVVLYQK